MAIPTRQERMSARFVTSKYALQVCLKAGFTVFRAKKAHVWDSNSEGGLVEGPATKGYWVEASKSQLLELGLVSNSCEYNYSIHTHRSNVRVRSFKDWQTSVQAHECAWAHEGVEVDSVETGETDVGGNPIAGHFVRHDNGQEIGCWGVDGERLLFPDGTVVEFI